MKKIIILLLAFAASPLITQGAGQVSPSGVGIAFYKDSPLPQAVVLSLNGQCRSSMDGQTFKKMKIGDVLEQGAMIQTGENGKADLFMRRMAVTIRVTPETELQIEKMVKKIEADDSTVETILNLTKGRILCFVRGVVPNSRFEVKHSGVRSLFEGEGMGGFEVRSDSAAVAPRQSYVPLKIVSDKGVAVLAPGQKYSLATGKAVDLAPTEVEDTLMQLDELQALADLLSPAEQLPAKRAPKALISKE